MTAEGDGAKNVYLAGYGFKVRGIEVPWVGLYERRLVDRCPPKDYDAEAVGPGAATSWPTSKATEARPRKVTITGARCDGQGRDPVTERLDNFAAIIREIRDAHHFSQAELADKLGVSERTVGRWENGDAYPKGSAVTRAILALRDSS